MYYMNHIAIFQVMYSTLHLIYITYSIIVYQPWIWYDIVWSDAMLSVEMESSWRQVLTLDHSVRC